MFFPVIETLNVDSRGVPKLWSGTHYVCPQCKRSYKWKGSVIKHLFIECDQEPQQTYKTHQEGHLRKHMALQHKIVF